MTGGVQADYALLDDTARAVILCAGEPVRSGSPTK